ncbi:mechanosensitive ion channel family protein [Salinadaptatus halalkaliphilus]|uniref:Mechanosensitive ion channel family protein n=1 Tax=Salinadaptatus halalkaliphilus TaxID=2419781 RepID=A0A4S3TNU1_9EURY|nr:mechanosensitive ion channel family protein [Salinadaptatus halalkaliphilus]THE65941.1 mechanosensitive ion channel family protein [Salinadaptatus halalkaliphilus]
MAVESAGLDWLGMEIESAQLKLAITVAAVGILVAVLLTYRRLQSKISDWTRPLYGDVISTAILIITCAITLSVVLGLWEYTATVVDAISENGLDGDIVPSAIASFVLVIGTVIVMRFVKRIVDEVLGSASAVTDHQREITHRVAQVIVWAISCIVILAVWIDDLTGLLAGAGFLGIVIGMAARQTLGTVLAGFVLMFSRPFEIGDWVEIEDKQGIVTDISIVNTRVRSFDGEYIMIPNDVVSSEMVTNRSRRGRLRIEIDIGVDYDADIEYATERLEAVLADLERSLDAPSPQVVSKEFGDSAIVLGARFWITNPSARRYWRARTAAVQAIKRDLEAESIDIPYPQRELSGRDDVAVRVGDSDGAEPTVDPPDSEGDHANVDADGTERMTDDTNATDDSSPQTDDGSDDDHRPITYAEDE